MHDVAIDHAVLAGILSGYPDGTYRPHAPVRRDQFARMVALLHETDGYTAPAGRDAFDPSSRPAR